MLKRWILIFITAVCLFADPHTLTFAEATVGMPMVSAGHKIVKVFAKTATTVTVFISGANRVYTQREFDDAKFVRLNGEKF